MKVNGIYVPNTLGGVKASTPSAVAPVEKYNTFMGRDDLAVSDNAQLFQKLLQKAKDVPDIREETIQNIINRIENGQFDLDSSSLARSILGI